MILGSADALHDEIIWSHFQDIEYYQSMQANWEGVRDPGNNLLIEYHLFKDHYIRYYC